MSSSAAARGRAATTAERAPAPRVPRANPWLVLAPLAAAVLAVAAWSPLVRLELLGWDAYPLILAHRARSAGELWSTVGSELMDGLYPLGRYWRPLTQLTFALDHALWGIEPAGYHATDLALMAACAAATAALALRLIGGRAPTAALVAGAVYALHPAHLEILPAAARRAESLSVLFTLLALLATPAGDSQGKARRWLAALFALAAVASKETGLSAVALVLVLAFAAAPARSLAARAGCALRAGWPSVAAVALFVAARIAVLGGIGGSGESSLAGALVNAPSAAYRALHGLVDPRALLRPEGPSLHAALALATLALAGAAGALLALLLRRLPPPARPAPFSRRELFAFLALGYAAVAAVTGISGVFQEWYLLPFLPLFALLLGLLAGEGGRALRAGSRPLGACALALPLALLVWHAGRTPRLDPPEAVLEASRRQRAFLERLEASVRAARPGTTVALGEVPTELQAIRAGKLERRVFMVSVYSLDAYAALALEDRPARVEAADWTSPRPRAEAEVRVVLQSRADPRFPLE